MKRKMRKLNDIKVQLSHKGRKRMKDKNRSKEQEQQTEQ